MKLERAIVLLKHHQKWRLGANIAMVKPKVLTKAIDVVLKEIEHPCKEDK